MTKRIIGLFLMFSIMFSGMVLAASEAIIIATNQSSSYAIRPDGSLWAWGRNQYGQLGDGTTEMRMTPIWIMDDVIAVSAMNLTTMALRSDGTLWTWGNNVSGQIGDGTITTRDRYFRVDEDNNRHSPVKIMDNVISISMGYFNAAAIRADGSLWTWGSNASGQIGDGTQTRSEFIDDTFTVIENNNRLRPVRVMEDVIAVRVGSRYMMAIRSDNSLWIWGLHKLGDYITDTYPSPVKVAENIAEISAGSHHAALITNEGRLWTWGDNNSGEIGDGTKNVWNWTYVSEYGSVGYLYRSYARLDFVEVLDDAISVYAGHTSTTAIRSDNSLWVWGREGHYTKLYPERLMENVLYISRRENKTLVIKTDGSLWTWGLTYLEELADEPFGGTNRTPAQVFDSVMLPTNLPIRVIVNSTILALDTNPTVVNDRTLVPFRAIFEALGMEVEWDADTQTAIGVNEELKIGLPVGALTAYINGAGKTLDAPTIIQDGRTLVPLRFVAEAMGANVSWDGSVRIVRINM